MKLKDFTMQYELFTEELFDELEPLLKLNIEETGIIEGEPSYVSYQALQDANALYVFTLRYHGLLVGYGSWIVGMHQQSSTLVGANDAIYVVPEARVAALPFIKYMIKEVETTGCAEVHIKDSYKNPLTRLADKLGFEPVSTTYRRVV